MLLVWIENCYFTEMLYRCDFVQYIQRRAVWELSGASDYFLLTFSQ